MIKNAAAMWKIKSVATAATAATAAMIFNACASPRPFFAHSQMSAWDEKELPEQCSLVLIGCIFAGGLALTIIGGIGRVSRDATTICPPGCISESCSIYTYSTDDDEYNHHHTHLTHHSGECTCELRNSNGFNTTLCKHFELKTEYHIDYAIMLALGIAMLAICVISCCRAAQIEKEIAANSAGHVELRDIEAPPSEPAIEAAYAAKYAPSAPPLPIATAVVSPLHAAASAASVIGSNIVV